jgi:translocator protein
MGKSRSNSLLAFAGFGVATAAAAWFGSRYAPPKTSRVWYSRLKKPSYNPPREVFPVVWTTLYALMAWSAWRIWSAPPSKERTRALKLWAEQLTANAVWSKLFFGEHRPDLSLMDSAALEILIVKYIRAAGKVDVAAAAAFIPYAAWGAFATFLNAEIVRLNR